MSCSPDDPYFVPAGPLTVEVIDVDACEMTDTQFKYPCKCKKGFHVHGNGGDPWTNRVEDRTSHCQGIHKGREMRIHITDSNTIRKLKSKPK